MKHITLFFRVFSFIFVLLVVSSCDLASTQKSVHNSLAHAQCNAQSQFQNSPSCGTPTSVSCVSTYVYSDVVHVYDQYQVVFDREEDVNYSTNNETVTLTATKSGTVSISADIHLGGPLVKAILKGLLDISIQASASVTAEIGNQTSVSLPPSEEALGKYGVFIQKVSVHLRATNCPKEEDRTITVYAPLRKGWCTWTTSAVNPTNQDPCPPELP